jgi:hypothetical protein
VRTRRLFPAIVRRSAVGSLVLGLVVGGLVVAAPPASAAGLRYAAPGGTDAQDCLTPATACSITKAINLATAGDHVILAPGGYAPSVPLDSSAGISVQGTPGQPRPVITTSAGFGLRLRNDGSRAADLTIVHTGPGRALEVYSFETVERVDVRTSGSLACFVGINNRLRDSLCVSTAATGVAVATDANSTGSHLLRLRNVTAVATGPAGTGIVATLGQSGTLTMNLLNVIASGATDIVRQPEDSATVTVFATYSNYDTATGSGPGTLTAPGSATNQTAAPVFADTTGYHQTATSPTVDMGAGDGHTGTVDLDGDNRQVGPAPDIGVDEYVVPPPDTTAPNTRFKKKPKKRTFSHRAKFVFTSTEAGSTFTCRLDKKRAKPCSSPFKKRVKKLGKHKILVWARDAAGNTDPTPAKYTWTIKRKPR